MQKYRAYRGELPSVLGRQAWVLLRTGGIEPPRSCKSPGVRELSRSHAAFSG